MRSPFLRRRPSPEEAARLLAAIDEHRTKAAAAADDPGHYRILDSRVAYVPVVYDQQLPDFLLRVAAEVERLLESDEVASHEGVSHVSVEWVMDEGWSAFLVIE